MPPPGEMELRELGSPVPQYTTLVSEGAMARSPPEATRAVSSTGKKVVPPLMVFHTPPAAVDT
jgi:hypothetical protein